MSYASIRMETLTPHVGAEIHGVDLGRPLDERTFQEVHNALVEHGVIFFRDQHLTPEQQKAFGRLFGELHMHPAAPSLLEGHPEILVIHADEKSKRVAGKEWHSDVSCDPEPPMGSILYMHELPPVGGDTLFASMYAAYDTLSDTMKRLLEPLSAMHDGEHVSLERAE
jgi:taurine dioxygenase